MPKAGTVPHTALIYTNKRNRNELLESVTKRANATWNALKILSSEPKADASFFTSKAWKAPQRGRPSISMVDMERFFMQMRNPVNDITSIIESPSGGGPSRLTISDWLYRVYDKFDVGLAIEEESVRRQRRNLICCFRGEGFWSLDVKQISRIFELHDEVVFGGTVLRMRG